MFRRLLLLTPLALVGWAETPAVDISGKWTCHVKFFIASGDPSFEFKQNGDKLTGIYHGHFGDGTVTGTVKDGEIEFTAVNAQGSAYYKGTLTAGGIEGTAKYPRPLGTGHFEGHRSK